MNPLEPSNPAHCWPQPRLLVKTWLALTACAIVVSVARADTVGRGRGHGLTSTSAALAAAPALCLDMTAPPRVTSPGEDVARFSVFPLPLIATIVDARTAREVLVARIGGLYGP